MKRSDFLRAPRYAAVAIALSALSGCALPPIITVMSIAADFASYGETGKTVTDHGLSLVAQKDCAMFRAIDNEPICVEEDESAASGDSVAGDDPARPRVYRPNDLADLQEEANRVMAFYPVNEELRREVEAAVDLGYPMASGVAIQTSAAKAPLYDAAYLEDGVRAAGPAAGSRQLGDAGYLADEIPHSVWAATGKDATG